MDCITTAIDPDRRGVNIILFETHELDSPLPRQDRRAIHIIDVLRRSVGDSFDAGLINGPRGKGTVIQAAESGLLLSFTWSRSPGQLDPLVLLVGLPRPQTARDLLRDMTTLGVSELRFVRTDRSEPSYASSTLWSSGEWRRHLIAGAEQAFETRIPNVIVGAGLIESIAALSQPGLRLALDNYEPALAMGRVESPKPGQSVALAVGPERGWSAREREILRQNGFLLVDLGPRVLRVETAAIAGVSIIQSKR